MFVNALWCSCFFQMQSSAVTPSPQASLRKTCVCKWQAWRSCIVSDCVAEGVLHLWIKQVREFIPRLKSTVITYNLQKKRSVSRKREETSLTPAIWRRKQSFLIGALIKEDARWLSLWVPGVCYWQAGWKMKGSRSWRCAPEMPTDVTQINICFTPT